MAPLLLAASARAAGGLVALDVSRCCNIPDAVVLRVVAANAGALRELRVCHGDTRAGLSLSVVGALLRAAPRLRALHADLDCDAAEAHLALRNEDVFGPLRVRQLRVRDAPTPDAAGATLSRDVAAHASLRALCLQGAHGWLAAPGWLTVPGALDALVDAALAVRLHTFSLLDSDVPLVTVAGPALARLLDGGTLTTLTLSGFRTLAEEADTDAATAPLRDALRASSALTSLTLRNTPFSLRTLLGGLIGHPSLRTLRVLLRGCAAYWQVDAALTAIVAANAPALTALDVSSSRMGDARLAALLAALARNTHLRALDVSGNALTAAFARDTLLPAARAARSLRELNAADDNVDWPAAREAEALVAARAAADDAQAGA
jgi:hypothetical protein